jgi:hypothetical protein
MRSDGRWELEPKQEIHKRSGRSPDWGDAVAMCFALMPKSWLEMLKELSLNQIAPPIIRDVPGRYVLNRRTKQVQLVAAPQSQVRPIPLTTKRETLTDQYLEMRNLASGLAVSSRAHELCSDAESRLEAPEWRTAVASGILNASTDSFCKTKREGRQAMRDRHLINITLRFKFRSCSSCQDEEPMLPVKTPDLSN